jgi:hypothetical protein
MPQPALSALLRIPHSIGKDVGKDVEITLGATTNANAAVLRGDKGHAYKHTARDQPIKNSLGKSSVSPAINRDKIGG